MNKKKAPNLRRVRQHRRTVEQFIGGCGGVDSIFQMFKNRPNFEQALEMFNVGKFGGSEPLSKGGIEFALEYAFDEFNEVFNFIRQRDGWRKTSLFHEPFYVFGRTQNEPWANLFFTIHVDQDFAPFVSNLSRSEFVRFTEHEEELIHDQTRSIVFDLKFMGQIKKSNKRIKAFVGNGNKFSQSELKGEAVYWYAVWIASPDLYSEDESEGREAHSVRAHTRRLASGKKVPVRPHSRRNKLVEAGVPWDAFDDHIVYGAYDIDGALRYIGEGRPGRFQHVNSGTSHNYKLNQHHFLRGEMKIRIFADLLSKPKALAIEKFLIARNASKKLWNVRENPLHGDL